MRVICEPLLEQWQPAFGRVSGRNNLAALLDTTLGGGETPTGLDRVIAAGHQPWLWHPGILAKDLALVAAARRFDAIAIHLVVDHDVGEPLQLALPVKRGDRLSVHTLDLAPHDTIVPTGCQDPVDADGVIHVLIECRDRLGASLQVDLDPIIKAYTALPPCRTRAEQTSTVLARLMRPYVGPVAHLLSTSLDRLAGFHDLVSRMAGDARHCAACYNQAVRDHAEAGVALLRVQGDRVELPLWALGRNEPRRRVYVETGAGSLVLAGGRPLEPDHRLAPRALLLSAVMRSMCSDLFIHGRGGIVYDRATEQWWLEWLGQTLPPTVAVSADLQLELRAPLADQAEVERTVWWDHHLPHNIDRVLNLEGDRVGRKLSMLEHMGDDRDRVRRAAVFAEIHRINRELAVAHPQILRDAKEAAAQARLGLANGRIATRRDWCFALYRPEHLWKLAAAFS